MPVVVTPVDLITLTVGADSVECQITSHTLTDADPSGGDKLRTGCGDIVTIPADATEVGTLAVTLLPDRADIASSFYVWLWAHAGETATFKLITNPGTPTAPTIPLEWSGELTVAAPPEKQEEYTKIETTDVTWSITKWTTRAAVPTP